MRTLKLFIRLTIYYVVLFGGIYLAIRFIPDVAQFLPIGDVEGLLVQGDAEAIGQIEIRASHITSQASGLAWLVFAILGAVTLMVPVSWVYIAVRSREGFDQSMVETMIVLPVAVTGIVLVVHNSLALAFSLAGIVAGVRFRNTLRSTADALFIFVAVGVGLASGIGMLIIAAVMSLIFNYLFLALWHLDYGGHKRGIKYMRRHLTRVEMGQSKPTDPDAEQVDIEPPEKPQV